MAIEWRTTPAGYAAAGFRIRRCEDRRQRWQLDAAPHRLSSRPGSGVATTVHQTLGDAMRWANRLDAERHRRALVRGYVAIGSIAAMAFVVTGSLVQGIPLFVVAVLSAFTALRSFVNAIALAMGDAWSWSRDGGVARRSSRADRVLEAWIAALEGPPQWDHAGTANASVVVVAPDARPHPLVRQAAGHRSRKRPPA